MIYGSRHYCKTVFWRVHRKFVSFPSKVSPCFPFHHDFYHIPCNYTETNRRRGLTGWKFVRQSPVALTCHRNAVSCSCLLKFDPCRSIQRVFSAFRCSSCWESHCFSSQRRLSWGLKCKGSFFRSKVKFAGHVAAFPERGFKNSKIPCYQVAVNCWSAVFNRGIKVLQLRNKKPH